MSNASAKKLNLIWIKMLVSHALIEHLPNKLKYRILLAKSDFDLMTLLTNKFDNCEDFLFKIVY